MPVTLTTLITEVQARCNALNGSSTISAVIDAAIAAKKVERAGGSITRTTLDTELQRVVNLSGGGSQIEDLIALAASVEQSSAGAGSRVVKKYQLFATAGSFTWTRPASLNGSIVYVTMIGGGSSGSKGGSGSARWGCGGYAGQFVFRAPYDVGLAASVSVIVGDGGAGVGTGSSTENLSGNPGGVSSFGSLAVVGGVATPSGTASTTVSQSWPGGHVVSGATPTSAIDVFFPEPLPCPWAAPAATHGYIPSGKYVSGRSGLNFPGADISPAAGTPSGDGGMGFGAGGAGCWANVANSSAGNRGAVLVEWEEFVNV